MSPIGDEEEQMKTTTYNFGNCIVNIHDPADTPEKKAKQRERIEKACVRFWEAMEREAGK